MDRSCCGIDATAAAVLQRNRCVASEPKIAHEVLASVPLPMHILPLSALAAHEALGVAVVTVASPVAALPTIDTMSAPGTCVSLTGMPVAGLGVALMLSACCAKNGTVDGSPKFWSWTLA
jgi:hypothetical protein